MITLPELENIILFLTMASILIIIPGPAVLYIVAKSMEHGYKAGITSVIGIGVGGLFHVMAAAFGISAIVTSSVLAFSVLKYLGAVYLIYLGIKKLREKHVYEGSIVKKEKQKLSSIFYEGVLVNILNPKTAVFFFAFLPQFVTIEKGGVVSQITFLGLLFIVVAVLSDSIYLLLSGKIANRIKSNSTFLRMHNYIIGTIYIILGLITLSASHPSSHNKNK